ncbi:phospho-N-acetylmuramoyl-pentapeptide-transferase [Anoxybacter fermentans]|uniref:Phospho-N-acetylmuramoyl-pentapeptide-transferase n=1 Tax=Anoxybacter fermentans TaxID=1323375 RepID=A0A3Q9HQ40_9FIRM|nr:phospho-N-acetylmuramoyl-pentapeptide-transferase [Anoxybacter fermentans]AZR73039.1 phospho-N-acetylmuramoyl-pentapeptide-transferase [Anoxybacter fermentans]
MIKLLYALGLSFLITIITGPGLIRILYRLKFGQQIREVGPKSHLMKQGTPTMGGVMIILAILVSTFLIVQLTDQILWSLFLTLGFGLIGFLDDLIKIVAKRSLGLKAWQKIVGQLILSSLLAFYVIGEPELMEIMIPFTRQTLNLGFLMLPFVIFVVIGTVNAVNLTDGLDGLAAGVTIVVSLTFTLMLVLQGNMELAGFALILAGACVGFAWFNSHPAQVFMGDTGSFALGGALAAISIFSRTELFLVIIGGIYVINAISVMLQVIYFRLTGGKRVFKMAPIHHHFELSGWREPQVVSRFVIISILLSVIGMIGYMQFV